MLLHNLLPSALLLLCYSLIQPTTAQSSTASWQFPLQDGFTIDVIDTIILQWTSNYKEAWLLMWCQKNGPGEDVSLGSEFRVQPNGTFPYILFSQNLAQRQFPVACHAQLAVEQKGTGVDWPVGITWTSKVGAQAQTFSLAKKEISTTSKSTQTTSSTLTTSTLTPSPSLTGSLPITTSSPISTTPILVAEPTLSSTPAPAPVGSTPTVQLAIGLSLGLTLLLILLSAFIYFLFIRRRRPNPDGSPQSRRWTLPANLVFGRHELEDEPRRLHEMEGKGDLSVGRAELHSEALRAELDGEKRKTLVGGEMSVDRNGKRKSGRKSRWGGKESVYEMP